MSLAIDPNTVIRILLHDGWHGPGTLSINAYEFITELPNARHDEYIWYTGGPGFAFIEDDSGETICGPISSIIALKTNN